MLFRSPQFALHARGKGGAILEGDEGETRLPNSVQISLGVGGPLETAQSLAAGTNRTVWQAANGALVGVTAGFNTVMATLTAGIWIIDWQFAARFTGTTNAGATTRLTLTDPQAFTTQFAQLPYLNGFDCRLGSQFAIDLPTSGWEIRSIASATVAGDVLYHFARILCQPVIS